MGRFVGARLFVDLFSFVSFAFSESIIQLRTMSPADDGTVILLSFPEATCIDETSL